MATSAGPTAMTPLKYDGQVDSTTGYLTPITTPREENFFACFDDDDNTSSATSTPPPPPPPPISRLLELPPDLLLTLADHLPAPSTVSLRLTCRALFRTIPAPPRPPEESETCLLQACNRHLQSLEDLQDSRARCALCKSLYPVDLFRRASILSPSLAFTNFATAAAAATSSAATPTIHESSSSSEEDLAIATSQALSHMSDDKPDGHPCYPAQRICAWHINRFIFPPTAALSPDPAFDALVSAVSRYPLDDVGGGNHGSSSPAVLRRLKTRLSRAGWASSVETCCMHCGSVVVCVCSVALSSSSPSSSSNGHGGGCGVCSGCDCRGCGTREVRCWWKLATAGRNGGRGDVSLSGRERSFRLARRRWLVARAEDATRLGGGGGGGGRFLDWGMVRVAKCANGARRMAEEAEKGRKRKAEE